MALHRARKIPQDQTWEQDYQLDEYQAERHALEVLKGGPPIGHCTAVMSHPQAERFWRRFLDFFEGPLSFYSGLGPGERNHVFQHGVAVVSKQRAGLLWVVESD